MSVEITTATWSIDFLGAWAMASLAKTGQSWTKTTLHLIRLWMANPNAREIGGAVQPDGGPLSQRQLVGELRGGISAAPAAAVDRIGPGEAR